MDLRSAHHVHFIQAVKFGVVEKIRNVDSQGRPGLAFKALKDIYDNEDANRCANFSKEQLEDKYEGMSFDSDGPIVERKIKKRGIDSGKVENKSENEEESALDNVNFGKITLKQLKNQRKVKQRKITSDSVTVKEEFTDSQPEEETDLNETIISWKSKVSKKPKGKKKSPKKCAQNLSQAKSEPILSSKDSLESGVVGLPSLFKVENSVIESSEPVVMISEARDCSVICSEQVVGLSGEIRSENIEDVENDSQSGNQLSLTEKSETCPVNGICYDHLEDIEDGIIMECPEMNFPKLLNSLFSKDEESSMWSSTSDEYFFETAHPLTEQNLDLHTKDSVLEISSLADQISGVQVPAMSTESTNLCDINGEICENMPSDVEFDSLSSSLEESCSSQIPTNGSNHEIILVCEEDDLFSSQEPPVTSVSSDTERECNPVESPAVILKVSATDEENQSLFSPPNDTESISPDRIQHCDSVCEISIAETGNHNIMGLCHPPERLLSTRKVISPTSQERLCQAMKGVELLDDVDHCKCKGKLLFENEAENAPLSKGQGPEITKNEGLGALSGHKVTIMPKRNSTKKNSPPKGSRKSTDVSRSLPNFNTGTRSLQKCSESAIVFSQRQMHDFDCLATKLMQELNSMRDIVEGKLCSETSPTKILKYDVDKVKMAVKSAKKAEETTRKWLSMMTRDCNRFCTIMKLTEKGEETSPQETNKDRRKISFADEAGGVLCHVKVFEDGMASLDSQR